MPKLKITSIDFETKIKTQHATEQLTSLIIKYIMVFGTISFIVLLTIVRYDATNERMLST